MVTQVSVAAAASRQLPAAGSLCTNCSLSQLSIAEQSTHGPTSQATHRNASYNICCLLPLTRDLAYLKAEAPKGSAKNLMFYPQLWNRCSHTCSIFFKKKDEIQTLSAITRQKCRLQIFFLSTNNRRNLKPTETGHNTRNAPIPAMA